MHHNLALCAILGLWSSGTVARFLGPLNPPPTDLTSQTSVVRSQWEAITSRFQAHFTGQQPDESLSGLNNITFSLGLFSIHDEHSPCLQYHHMGPDVRNSTLGVKHVDGDSIYRVASMSKLITVYAGLLLLDPSDWHKPITEIFPEITSLPANDPLHHVQWATITPFSLASQISGLPRDASPFAVGEVAYDYYFGPNPIDPTTLGLPPLTLNSTGVQVPCQTTNCTGVEYIAGIQSPLFPVFQTTGYSDTNFILLGRVISKLTGLPINEQWFQKAVFEPLNMTHTSALSPTKKPYSGYVVLGDAAAFAIEGGISSSAGGVFSSTNDVSKLGLSILSSSLLSPSQTRKWLKPTTFTAGSEFAQGLGWEIYRYTDPKTGAVTDMYTKLGDSGAYASYLVVVPDYGFGFSVLSGSGLAGAAQRSAGAQLLADLVSENILPALRDQAAVETKRRFEGVYRYRAAANTKTKGKNNNGNDSLTLAFNDSPGPSYGLTLTGLVSRGVDMMPYLQEWLGGDDEFFLLAPTDSIPTTTTNNHNKANKNRNGKGTIQEKAFVVTPVRRAADKPYTGLFSKQFATNDEWVVNNVRTYGGQAFGTFFVDVDERGRAVAVSPAVLRGKKFVR